MDHTDLVIIGRVAGALVIGAMIGFERTFHGRPAGFRTHALVCVASAILMIVTVYQGHWMTAVDHDAIRTDPTRMAQGIMTGIGFLGAGVIFKEGLTVRGLTTAASIWVTAAIGILVGIGFWFAAVVGAAATFDRAGRVPVDRGATAERILCAPFAWLCARPRHGRKRRAADDRRARLLDRQSFVAAGRGWPAFRISDDDQEPGSWCGRGFIEALVGLARRDRIPDHADRRLIESPLFGFGRDQLPKRRTDNPGA